MSKESLIPFLLAITCSPLMFGIINRTKAIFAGRKGRPLFQLYYDIFKLLRKSVVYSTTTSWVFQITPVLTCGVLIVAVCFIPLGKIPALVSFSGDFFVLVYLLALVRFFMIMSALDTGSSFCGMGASREAFFSALIELATVLGLLTVAFLSKSLSLSRIYSTVGFYHWVERGPIIVMVIIALFIALLAENSRIPIDDPETHLELTMIHEAMILDNSGPDLALILYGSSLKLWIFGSLIVGLACPVANKMGYVGIGIFLIGMLLLSTVVGIVESSMARLRFTRIPQFLVGASVLAALALFLVTRM